MATELEQIKIDVAQDVEQGLITQEVADQVIASAESEPTITQEPDTFDEGVDGRTNLIALGDEVADVGARVQLDAVHRFGELPITIRLCRALGEQLVLRVGHRIARLHGNDHNKDTSQRQIRC